MVDTIGGRISVMTEWLGKKILDGFLRQFQTKADGTSTRKYNAKLQRKWYLTVLIVRVLLTFSVYISCLYSGFITAAQLSRRPTRQRLDAFVVCTPQQTLLVLFTRSTWLSGTVTRCGLRSYSSSSKSTTTLRIFFRNNLLVPASAASQAPAL